MAWYYTFEAKEIQGFILQSDKLRDMVGGSELVARLCGSFLMDALKAIGVREPESVIIANAAGWARLQFEQESQAREFAMYWPMLVSRYAPGLKLIQSLEKIEGTLPEALKKGMDTLREKRNLNETNLPETGPLIERNPRTGSAATDVLFDKKTKKQAPVDQQTRRKQKNAELGSLVRKIAHEFAAAADIPLTAWPYEIEEIASDKSAYVAVIHADGNDLGSTLMRIGEHLKIHPDQAAGIYRDLSAAIDRITVSAVQAAAEKTLFSEYRTRKNGDTSDKKIAARPIVLGGDDLTIIVRADLAVKFTADFLSAFESNSRTMLAGLRSRIPDFPELLTACAGIAFVKKSYPFAAAYHMAESLCDHTKKIAKADRDRRKKGDELVPVPSSYTYYRISTSMAEGFSDAKKHELTGRGQFENKPISFWYGPYAVGDLAGGLPHHESLETLVKSLQALPTGSIRTLISTMHTDPVSARKDYGRILEVAEKKKADALQNALLNLTGGETTPLWNNEMRTPLADAHLLNEILKGGSDA